MTAAATLPYPAPATSGQYAADLDAALGAPGAGADLAVTSAWVQAESPGFPGWNGLGTELDLPGAVPDPSNPAVYDYPNLQTGLEAAVDMMLGQGPQTTPLETKFVSDLRSGQASEAQLISDIRSGGWAGSGPDTYDANAIQAKLAGSGFSVAGAPAAGISAATGPGAPNAQLTGFDWNPVSWPGQVAGAAVSTLAGTVGVYILKGVLTLIGGGMIVYGGVVLTGRGRGNKGTASSPTAESAPAEKAEESAPGPDPFASESGSDPFASEYLGPAELAAA